MMLLAARIASFGAVGLALGAAHLTTLRLNTRLYLGRHLRRAAVLHIARFLLLAAVFAIVAHAGAQALVTTFIGFLAARPLLPREGAAP